ncbi:MAG: S8 family serine peptidase [Chitinophagales bacterium]|nr:S8 family serine peptidase [Chitinophagales bacterium]
MHRLFFFFLILIPSETFAQDSIVTTRVYHKFWIQFSDKNNNPFSVERPYEFLSQKSIDRRSRQNISIQESDLPVTPSYVSSVKNTGAKILIKSKWMNGVCVETTDSAILEQIDSLPFVSFIEAVAAYSRYDTIDSSGIESYPMISSPVLTSNLAFDEELYGNGFNQINMMNGEYLHELGFRGDGMTVAVLDAGFFRVNTISAFDSLWLNDRILGYKDFVGGQDDSVFIESTHGMQVLSTMAANLPGELVGTAPAAHYWLIRTEDARSEFRIEEYNWAAGAEFADSAGVDVINSSLGYSTFNDTAMNYSYATLDGKTAVVTHAADKAVETGMIVVTSAGNNGNAPWKYISTPADANNVIAVGAVDPQENYASFSSQGPSSDGRVKPDVAAQGKDAVFVSRSGSLTTGNGTSFASPITAGLVTCFWQAFYDKPNMEIIQQILQSASRYTNPDELYGNGIPDFRLAFLKMQEKEGSPYFQEMLPVAYPNPFDEQLHVMLFADDEGKYSVEIFDALGRIISRQEQYLGDLRFHDFEFKNLDVLQQGVYFVRTSGKGRTDVMRVVKF